MSAPSPKTVSLARLRTGDQERLEAWVRLADTSARLVRRIEQFAAEHGVTLPQFDVLGNLLLRDGLTQQELAERLQVTKGNVCGLVDRLEKLGWVVRRPDEHDGRINRLSATPAGRAVVERIRPLHDKLVLELLSPLSDEHVARLTHALTLLDKRPE